jgi:transposase
MNPVVGLDVSKGESEVQAFFDKGKPHRKSFSISHTIEGLNCLVEYFEELIVLTGIRPPVVLESTGYFHLPVVQYLKERDYLLIIVNPLVSYRAKSSNLRKVKTDVIDAYHLCELYYKEELEPYKKRGIQLLTFGISQGNMRISQNFMYRLKYNFNHYLIKFFRSIKGFLEAYIQWYHY